MASTPPSEPHPPHELPSSVFARRVRREREDAGMTQSELAERIGGLLGIEIDVSAIGRIEKQTRAVRLDEAVMAARALGIPLSMLLSDDPAEKMDEAIAEQLQPLVRAQAALEDAQQAIPRLMANIRRLVTDRAQYEPRGR